MAPSGGGKSYTLYQSISILSTLLLVAKTQAENSCTVFEPFKVEPDNAKYKIGGPFPLHEPDCEYINVNNVQNLVAVQWALSHWNQNPANQHAKIAMHAGDTCARPQQALAMTLEFLQSGGLFQAVECERSEAQPKILGFMCSSDFDSSAKVSRVLSSQNALPILAYSTDSLLALREEQKMQQHKMLIISTAPHLKHYLQAAVKLLMELDSDLVTLVLNAKYQFLAAEISQILLESGITVEAELLFHDPTFYDQLIGRQSNITVTCLSTRDLRSVISRISLEDHLIMNLPLDGAVLRDIELQNMLPAESKLQIVMFQQHLVHFPDFESYFVGVVRNNYPSYELLAGYMQQAYNCTLSAEPGYIDCAGVHVEYMASQFTQAPSIEQVVLATYALTTLAAELEIHPPAKLLCDQRGIACERLMKDMLLGADYKFTEYDPEAFEKFRLQFEEIEENTLTAKSIFIRGEHIFSNRQFGVTQQTIIEFVTGSLPESVGGAFSESTDNRIRSQCNFVIQACQKCAQTWSAPNSDQLSLSLPSVTYDGYLLGVFDLSGPVGQTQPLLSDLLYPLAFVHTLHTVGARYPHLEITERAQIGALVLDSAQNQRRNTAVMSNLLEKCAEIAIDGHQNLTIVPDQLLGVLSGANYEQTNAISYLFDFSTPTLVSRHSKSTTTAAANPSLFSLAPATDSQSVALMNLLLQNDWNWVTVIISSRDQRQQAAYDNFRKYAEAESICIAEELYADSSNLRPAANVVLMFTTGQETFELAPLLNDKTTLKILVGPAQNWVLYQDGTPGAADSLMGALSVRPLTLNRSDFRAWLDELSPSNLPEAWFLRFYEEHFKCALSEPRKRAFGGKLCAGNEKLDRLAEMASLSDVGYFIEAIESLLFAVDAANRKLCPKSEAYQPFCARFRERGRTDVRRTLNTVRREPAFEYQQFRPSTGLDQSGKYYLIGNYSAQQSPSIYFHSAVLSYDANGQVSKTAVKSSCRPPLCKCHLDKDFFLKPLQDLPPPKVHRAPSQAQSAGISSLQSSSSLSESSKSISSSVNNPEYVRQQQLAQAQMGGSLPSTVWAYVLIALISVLLLLALSVLVLVCVKLYLRVVKGNQSLGICLLVSVILLYATAYLFVLGPSQTICRLRFCAHSLAYTLAFGVMLAKATQLRNRETLGMNGPHISYWNYWLLLAFVVGVQLALNLQWLCANDNLLNAAHQCAWSTSHFVFSQGYVCLLLLVVVFVSVLNRNVKRNYKETRWLLTSAMLCVPIWAGWISAYLLLPAHYQNLIVICELLSCASVILCFMFGPKVYILLRYEPVLVEFSANYKLSVETQENKLPAMMRHQSFDYYDKDYYDDDLRATSPAASTSDASTRSTAISQCTASVTDNMKHQSNSSPDESPVLQAVIRKKTRSKRFKSRTPSRSGATQESSGYGQAATVHTNTGHPVIMPGVMLAARSSH